MESTKKVPILEIVAILIAIGSFVVSIRGCAISRDAEKNAEEAIALSKQQFLQTNRPHLLLSPLQFEDKMYWRFSEEDDGIRVYIRYRLQNVGNVAATDISLPTELMLGPKMKKVQVVLKKPERSISLGPGARMLINSEMKIEYGDEDDASSHINRLRSEESDGLTLQISVEYASEIDKLQRFRTVMMNRIHNDRAEIIKSEMYQIFDNEDSNN